MPVTYKQICAQQQDWARRKGIRFDKDGYTLQLNDNLFLPLSPEIKAAFEAGSGDELGLSGKRGKMWALHSSSALAVNVFEYWRSRDADAIAKACGAPEKMTQMQFEQTHPTPLRGKPPHLDVEFSGAGSRVLAVESKFTELYHYHTKRRIKEKYLSRPSLWAKLPRCEKLIRRIREEEKGKTSFAYLDIPQLLKHILGLSTEFGLQGFELLYLWYEVPSPEAEKHRQEIREFREHIGNEARFRDMTYQELFEVIIECPDVEEDYISYLAGRYFLS